MKNALVKEKYTKAPDRWKRFNWSMFILIGFIGLVVIGTVSFGFYRGTQLYHKYSPLTDASMEMRLEATTAYLWFEEMLGGDESKNLDDILKRLDKADWYAKAMIEGGESGHLKLLPFKESQFHDSIKTLQSQLKKQRELLNRRIEAKHSFGPGSEIDKIYHSTLENFIKRANKFEMDIKHIMVYDYQILKFIWLGIIVCCVFLFLIIGYGFYRYESIRRKSEERYKSLFNNNHSIMLLIDPENGDIVDANPAAITFYGWSYEEFIGKKITGINALTNEQVFQEMERAKREQRRQFYFSHRLSSGEIRDVEVYSGPITVNDKKLLYSIVHDITERKQAEEALLEGQKKIARLKKMESLGLLAGGVAHDLNNVLSGFVSYPELLLLELPEDSKLRKPIESMKNSGNMAVAIVQDLLTVARGVATIKVPLNLNDIIRDYLQSPEFYKFKEFYPTVTIKTNLHADLLNIAGSQVHIRKVIMNLVSNASEAIKGSGGVVISTVNRYIDKPLRGYNDVRTGEYAVLAVSDGGLGISSEDLDRIFEPFYTKKMIGRSGTGLGLAVVWNVVQDHKGYIDVQSTGNGTTFELYFPITREAITDEESPTPLVNLKGDGEKILVVDDVDTQREIACSMLNTLNYKANAVSSGEEAVKYLQEHSVDILLLDMIMDPGISGRKTYEKVIKIHPNQKAVIVSGFAETDEVRETQRLGAGRFIKKPLTLEKIGFALKDELAK